MNYEESHELALQMIFVHFENYHDRILCNNYGDVPGGMWEKPYESAGVFYLGGGKILLLKGDYINNTDKNSRDDLIAED